MSGRFEFNRMELAGSLGDLGTLLPIAIAMVLFNGLNLLGLFLSIGIFYGGYEKYKTSGAILFGVVNAFVPILMAVFLIDLGHVDWLVFIPAVFLISVASTFLGLFIAVAVSEVFEAQTFSNFFRFPMIFLCGLFFPISALPVFFKPLSYALPLTYGADMLHGAIHGGNMLSVPIDMAILAVFCVGLFMVSLRNIRRRWIA